MGPRLVTGLPNLRFYVLSRPRDLSRMEEDADQTQNENCVALFYGSENL